MLPKINGTNTNFSSVMDSYKKSFYNKKFSNEINLGGIQGKNVAWISMLINTINSLYSTENMDQFFYAGFSIFLRDSFSIFFLLLSSSRRFSKFFTLVKLESQLISSMSRCLTLLNCTGIKFYLVAMVFKASGRPNADKSTGLEKVVLM